MNEQRLSDIWKACIVKDKEEEKQRTEKKNPHPNTQQEKRIKL